MFGTIILDAYEKNETENISFALNNLCSPCDSYGWSSAGIYCFWDYYTREVLYIGLASDICMRFKQHNGLLSSDNNGTKQHQIEEYFNKKNKLGYTIFVQSPLSQPLVARNKNIYKAFAEQMDLEVENILSRQGKEDIKRVEGILIEAHRQSYGHLPKWNDIGGSTIGQHKVLHNNINIVKSFSHPENFRINPLISRSTLRELSDNDEYELFESNFLHVIRVFMLILGLEYEQALTLVNQIDILGYYHIMIESGYDKKKLVL